jgi:hypothetical protein
LADWADGLVQVVRKEVDALATAAAEVKEALKPALQREFAKDSAQFVTTQKALASKIDTVAKLCSRFRQCAEKKQGAEIDRFRESVLKIIRHNQRVQSLNVEQLFEKFDQDGDAMVSSDEFAAWFKTADRKIGSDGDSKEPEEALPKEIDLEDARRKVASAEDDEDILQEDAEFARVASSAAEDGDDEDGLGDEFSPAKLSRFFMHISAGEPKIPKEDFMRLIRMYYKCVKGTVVTDSKSIKDSTMVRRLDVNEVLEITEGPVKDESHGLTRVQGRMIKDGLEGWVTVAGNRGTPFLQRGGNLWKVVKETALSRTLVVEEGAATKTLKVGEVLDMHEAPQEDAASGFTRMKVKVKSDGAVGWVTTMESKTKVFIQVV